MKRRVFLVLALSVFVLAPGAVAFQRDVADPCPTYESCSILQSEYDAASCASSNYVSCYREVSYGSCLPYKECVTKTTDANGKVTRSACEQSGERSCAYSQDNPNVCGTLYVRRADCGRQG